MTLIEPFAPDPDVVEVHQIEIAAPAADVYQALWTTDLAGAPVVKGLLALRSLPALLLSPAQHPAPALTLHGLMAVGFGRLAEEPGREIVLGVAGRFWRPVGNILPFDPASFRGPVPVGLARAVWSFRVEAAGPGRTVLSTETRVACGDADSRLRFCLYWLLVGPFSGLIRRVMLRAVKRASEAPL